MRQAFKVNPFSAILRLAFAELQTEVSDFTSDLNVIGIPFWDYKMYTFRVLFPGFKTHAVLQDRNKVS